MSDSPRPAPGGPGGVPLVSVVVPFYNLRDWAVRCMDSLLAQDFDSFEVVCVDDGSTDGTAELLDSYATDPRVTVLHGENGGAAAARNYGVQHARADLVGFVDGDDLVAPNYLASLYGALASTGAELAMCPCVAVPPERLGAFEWPVGSGEPRVERMGPAEALSAVLYGRVPLSSWGKLAPREIYLAHPFPVGRISEDYLMFRWHFMSLDSFALVDAPLYVSVLRPGSITRGGRPPDEDGALDFAEALDVLESALDDFPEVAGPAVDRRIALEYYELHRLASRVRPCTARVEEVMADSRGRVRAVWPALRRDPAVGIFFKVRVWLLARIPWAYAPLARAWHFVTGQGWR